MTRRPPAAADFERHLEWLRVAVHDRKIDARLVTEGLLDAIEALAGMIPGPPHTPGPPDGTAEEAG